MNRIILFITVLSAAAFLTAQERGTNEAVAARYSLYIDSLIEGGRFSEAEAALKRAADYADISSDILYQLAFVSGVLRRPAAVILSAAQKALSVNRFRRYLPSDVYHIEAKTLLRMRHYQEALRSVQNRPYDADSACVKLEAFKGLIDRAAFVREASLALDRFPQEARIAEIILRYAARSTPSAAEEALLGRVLRAVWPLSESNPSLLYLAAPFVYDDGEARRMLQAYRAAVNAAPDAESLAVSLDRGLIDDEKAILELFSLSGLAKNDIEAVFSCLSSENSRQKFLKSLNSFTGTIKADYDYDGNYEAEAVYANGQIVSFVFDGGQDGINEIDTVFKSGMPDNCLAAGSMSDEGGVLLHWGDYPSVIYAEKNGIRYDFSPRVFFFAPFNLAALCDENGIVFPETELPARLTDKSLSSFAFALSRASREFQGAIETVELQDGIPLRASEQLQGRLVSQTEFENGFPARQIIDLDLNGTFETVRYFYNDKNGFYPEKEHKLSLQISDFNDNGSPEYKEEYTETGAAASFWDMDEDGVFEYSE